MDIFDSISEEMVPDQCLRIKFWFSFKKLAKENGVLCSLEDS